MSNNSSSNKDVPALHHDVLLWAADADRSVESLRRIQGVRYQNVSAIYPWRNGSQHLKRIRMSILPCWHWDSRWPRLRSETALRG